MSINIDEAQRDFGLATVNYEEEEKRRQLAALRLIAAHALAVAPEATHMLMESSDQGEYLTAPSFLTVGEEHVAEEEWDARVEEYEDDLQDAPGWLPWIGRHWQQYVDESHPYTNRRGGYYAVDLQRIAADAAAEVTEEPNDKE